MPIPIKSKNSSIKIYPRKMTPKRKETYCHHLSKTASFENGWTINIPLEIGKYGTQLNDPLRKWCLTKRLWSRDFKVGLFLLQSDITVTFLCLMLRVRLVVLQKRNNLRELIDVAFTRWHFCEVVFIFVRWHFQGCH